jgi:uncharacterized membrane protein YphA (DoxX/SURF4 family)
MLIFGIFHFINADKMGGMVPDFIPGGVFWIYLTGAGLIAASISFIINVQARLAGFLLAGMLMVFVLTIHLPGVINGAEATSQMAMMGLLKDFGLAAASLLIASVSPCCSKCNEKKE